MACLKRVFTCGCFFSLCLSFFGGWLFLSFLETRNADAKTAREVPIKSLAEVLNSDGPAWVKVRLEPASGTTPLLCGESRALWVRRQGRELTTQEIRQRGVWNLRTVWKPFQDDAQTVPIVLKADTATMAINDWIGIEIWPDLLQVRRENSFSGAESGSGTHDVNGQASVGIVVKRNWEEAFLPTGVDAWALGRFENGVPHVFLRDRLFLTGLGRDRFSQELEINMGNAGKYSWLCVIGGIVFGLLFLRSLLKSS